MSERGEVVHVVRDVRDDACGGSAGGVRGEVRGGALATPPTVAESGREPIAAFTRLCAAACITPLCQHTYR